jgi:multimeric flavodoxin WrbA
MTNIAVIVGSTREGSFNRALGELAAASLEAQGASVTRVQTSRISTCRSIRRRWRRMLFRPMR